MKPNADIPKKIKELIIEEIRLSLINGKSPVSLPTSSLHIFSKTVADNLVKEKRIIYGEEIVFFPTRDSFIPIRKSSLETIFKENEPGKLNISMTGEIIDFINLMD